MRDGFLFVAIKHVTGPRGCILSLLKGFIVQANALRAAPQCMTDLNSAYLPVSVPTVLVSEIGQIILVTYKEIPANAATCPSCNVNRLLGWDCLFECVHLVQFSFSVHNHYEFSLGHSPKKNHGHRNSTNMCKILVCYFIIYIQKCFKS